MLPRAGVVCFCVRMALNVAVTAPYYELYTGAVAVIVCLTLSITTDIFSPTQTWRIIEFLAILLEFLAKLLEFLP